MNFYFPGFPATPRTLEPRQGSNITARPDALAYVFGADPKPPNLGDGPDTPFRSPLADLGIKTGLASTSSRCNISLSSRKCHHPSHTSSQTKRSRKSGPTCRPNRRKILGTRAHLWLTVHHPVNRRTQVRSIYGTQGFGGNRQATSVTSVTSTDSDPPKRMSRRSLAQAGQKYGAMSGRRKGIYCPTRALRGRLLQAYTSYQLDCGGKGSTIWSPPGMAMVIKSMERLYTPKPKFQYCTRRLEVPLHLATLAPAPDGDAFQLAFTRFYGMVAGSR